MAMTVEVVVEPGCSRIPQKRPEVLEVQVRRRLQLGDLWQKVVVPGRCWQRHGRGQLTPGRGQHQVAEVLAAASRHWLGDGRDNIATSRTGRGCGDSATIGSRGPEGRGSWLRPPPQMAHLVADQSKPVPTDVGCQPGHPRIQTKRTAHQTRRRWNLMTGSSRR